MDGRVWKFWLTVKYLDQTLQMILLIVEIMGLELWSSRHILGTTSTYVCRKIGVVFFTAMHEEERPFWDGNCFSYIL